MNDGAHLSLPIPPRPHKVAQWRRPQFWAQGLIGSLLGGGLMFLALRAAQGLSVWEAMALCLALPLALWLQILIHEGGHAVAGLLSGQQLLACGVGPIRLERKGHGWHVRWSRSMTAVAGFVLMLPRSGSSGRWSATVYLLGGPLANLLVVALSIPWALAEPQAGTTLELVLPRLVAGTGLLIGVANLLPFMVGGWSTDGRHLLKLWQGSEEAKVMMFLRHLGGLSATGVRPRDWPLPSLETLRLDAIPQAAADALAQCCLYKAIDERAPDRPGVLEAARAMASRFWSGADATRPSKALLLSRWLVEVGGDLDEALAWAELAEGGIIDLSAERAALQALLAWRRGNAPQAEKHLREASGLRDRVQPGAALAMFDDDLASLRAQLSRYC